MNDFEPRWRRLVAAARQAPVADEGGAVRVFHACCGLGDERGPAGPFDRVRPVFGARALCRLPADADGCRGQLSCLCRLRRR